MRRGVSRGISKGTLVICLILSLGAGIGTGYAIKTKQANASNSEVDGYKAQILTLQSDIANLNGQIDTLTSGLNEKQADYDALQEQHDNTSGELESLKRNYSLMDTRYRTLDRDYQTLQQVQQTLEEACSNPTVEKIVQLSDRVKALEAEKSWLEAQKAALEKQVTPSPDHALQRDQVFYQDEFKSIQWKGRDYELQLKIEEIGRLYNSTHTYVPGETDCNDMAVDIWNMLLTKGIKSVIVIGNKDKENETFEECVHAWLYVFNANGEVIYLEPTTGEVLYGKLSDGTTNPKTIPYWGGFIYKTPSDLRSDLKNQW
ncbi:MAG: hypothetical protein FJZ95_03695 [Chloroflexi bacterium]|nr:hypothetical protein [Chloroflexota bacterium]